LQILMLGILTNSLAFIPYALIQADGRPDITAKLHLIELPIYLILLWYALHSWGIVGAAIAWSFRVTLDWAMLLAIATSKIRSKIATRLAIATAGLLITVFIMAQIANLPVRGLMCVIISSIFILINWRYVLRISERNYVKYLLINAFTGIKKINIISWSKH